MTFCSNVSKNILSFKLLFILLITGCTTVPVVLPDDPPETHIATNQAEGGVLGSTSDHELMNDSRCASDYSLQFPGENPEDLGFFFIIGDQGLLPNPATVYLRPEEPEGEEQECQECTGRLLRLVDLGLFEAKAPVLPQYEGEVFLFFFTLFRGLRSEELFEQSTYRDFPVEEGGEVWFGDLPLEPGHMYIFLISERVMAPFAERPHHFGSVEEFNATIVCSLDDSSPFTAARSFRAVTQKPKDWGELGRPSFEKIEISHFPKENLLAIPNDAESNPLKPSDQPSVQGILVQVPDLEEDPEIRPSPLPRFVEEEELFEFDE